MLTTKRQFDAASLNDRTAHIAIDFQRHFCDPRYSKILDSGNENTRNVAKKVRRLMPMFRSEGITNYVAFYGKKHQTLKTAMGGLFGIKVHASDKVIRKSSDSVFEGSNLNSRLRRDGVENIILSGVNLNACVHLTAVDGIHLGFNVCVLTDCVANDNRNDHSLEKLIIDDLRDNGVKLIKSRSIFNSGPAR